jgi:hypothetical protein
MTKPTRYFLVTSGLIVVAGLGTGLVAVYSGGLSGSSAQPLGELAYVSSEANAVAYADVRRIMDSEFRQRLRAVLPTGEGKARFLAETGIDIERDIDSVLVGLSERAVAAGGPLVLMRGRFDASRVESVALQHGASVEEYQGRRLVIAPPSSAGPSAQIGAQLGVEPAAGRRGDRPAMAFLEPGLVALGHVDAIKRSIDSAARGESALSNAELMRFVNDVADSGDAWIAGRPDSMPGRGEWPGGVKDHLSAVEWFALSADIDRALTCRLRAEARDEKAGDDLRAIVNGALALARTMAAQDTRLTGMLDSVQSTGTGAEMELSFTVSPEMIDMMMAGKHAELR